VVVDLFTFWLWPHVHKLSEAMNACEGVFFFFDHFLTVF
jgi:hypothetical protein